MLKDKYAAINNRIIVTLSGSICEQYFKYCAILGKFQLWMQQIMNKTFRKSLN